jgi:hypothetical protein
MSLCTFPQSDNSRSMRCSIGILFRSFVYPRWRSARFLTFFKSASNHENCHSIRVSGYRVSRSKLNQVKHLSVAKAFVYSSSASRRDSLHTSSNGGTLLAPMRAFLLDLFGNLRNIQPVEMLLNAKLFFDFWRERIELRKRSLGRRQSIERRGRSHSPGEMLSRYVCWGEKCLDCYEASVDVQSRFGLFVTFQ